ncbi:hypothetical protein [Legionella fallonii]|uniref:Uncharacterized protein n=1 Tax=Legionella fallonii LLAP-10 TaxID=1212491 RepID=A0A098G3C3_9GAMM|nr:hypothetical protein [Legionella fallonii]CEG56494.1 protein of unknown function [Legionella fallonii LLAP-10]
MKRKLDKTSQKNFELAELSIKNGSVDGFQQWIKNNDPEQTNRNGKTIVNVLIEDYIFKVKNRAELVSLYEMLELLKHTQSFQNLPSKTLYILRILCPQLLLLGFLLKDKNGHYLDKDPRINKENPAQFARDVYNANLQEFHISSLQRLTLPTLTQEQWQERLYGEEDFILSYSKDWHVREKRSIKIGEALITYQYGGKGSLEVIIERIDRSNKSTQIIFESEKMRRENTAFPFEAYIPFHMEDEGSMTGVGGFRPKNYPETIRLLNEHWEVRNKIAAMAWPHKNMKAQWNDLTSALKALSDTITEEKEKNARRTTNKTSENTEKKAIKHVTKAEKKRQKVCDAKIIELDAALKEGMEQFEKMATNYSQQDKLYSRNALDALEKKYSKDPELLWKIALISQKLGADYEPKHLFKVLIRIVNDLNQKAENNQEKILAFLCNYIDFVKEKDEPKDYFVQYVIRTISRMKTPENREIIIDFYILLKDLMSFTSDESFEIDDQLFKWQLRHALVINKSLELINSIIAKTTDFLEAHKSQRGQDANSQPEYVYRMRAETLQIVVDILQRSINKDNVMQIYAFYKQFSQPSVLFQSSTIKNSLKNVCEELEQSPCYREVNNIAPLPIFITKPWQQETLEQRKNLTKKSEGIVKPYQKEIEAVRSELNKFAIKINSLKEKNENPKVITIAENLYDELNNTVRLYEIVQQNEPEAGNQTKALFRKQCSKSINDAKSLLDKEQGWGDYLTNLLKSLVNAIISATNTISGSSFTLFALAKAPMHSEIEIVEEVIADDSMSLVN